MMMSCLETMELTSQLKLPHNQKVGSKAFFPGTEERHEYVDCEAVFVLVVQSFYEDRKLGSVIPIIIPL